MKTTPASLPELPPREWDFRAVPDEELDICFLYEYAREHVKRSRRWHTLTTRLIAPQGTKVPGLNGLHREIRSIFGKAPFLYWFALPDFVGSPWPTIGREERRREAAEFNHGRSQAHSFREAIALNITLARDLAAFAKAGADDYASWVRLDQCFHDETDQREYGFLAINWNHTDGQLVAAFEEWLADKRGGRADIESRQGKTKPRQHLKALGAKRLLEAGLTVTQAVEYTKRFLKDGAGNPFPLYDTPRGWAKAKNQIVPAVLEKLFAD